MKNSKIYSVNLKKFWKSAKPKDKIVKKQYDNPVEVLVYAVVREKLTGAATRKTLKKIKAHFVDWNDLRVSRTEEILEVLGGDSQDNRAIAKTLTGLLSSVFSRNDCLEMGYLIELGKRKAKEELEKFDGINPFISGFVLQLCLDSHSIPVNERMQQFLVENKLAHPKSGIDKIEGFLEKQIPSTQGYAFLSTLLELSDKIQIKNAKKKTAKKKAKAKSKKAK